MKVQTENMRKAQELGMTVELYERMLRSKQIADDNLRIKNNELAAQNQTNIANSNVVVKEPIDDLMESEVIITADTMIETAPGAPQNIVSSRPVQEVYTDHEKPNSFHNQEYFSIDLSKYTPAAVEMFKICKDNEFVTDSTLQSFTVEEAVKFITLLLGQHEKELENS